MVKRFHGSRRFIFTGSWSASNILYNSVTSNMIAISFSNEWIQCLPAIATKSSFSCVAKNQILLNQMQRFSDSFGHISDGQSWRLPGNALGISHIDAERTAGEISETSQQFQQGRQCAVSQRGCSCLNDDCHKEHDDIRSKPVSFKHHLLQLLL